MPEWLVTTIVAGVSGSFSVLVFTWVVSSKMSAWRTAVDGRLDSINKKLNELDSEWEAEKLERLKRAEERSDKSGDYTRTLEAELRKMTMRVGELTSEIASDARKAHDKRT